MKLLEISRNFEVLSKESSICIKGGRKKKKKKKDNGGTTPPPISYSEPIVIIP